MKKCTIRSLVIIDLTIKSCIINNERVYGLKITPKSNSEIKGQFLNHPCIRVIGKLHKLKDDIILDLILI